MDIQVSCIAFQQRTFGHAVRSTAAGTRELRCVGHVHEFLPPEIVRGHGVPVDDESRHKLRDFAVMFALEGMGWIDSHLAWSDETRRSIAGTAPALRDS